MAPLDLDRNRLFALLTALEDDLRESIRRHLLAHRSEAEVLANCYDRTQKRFDDDKAKDLIESDILDYLDLGDALEALARYRSELPPTLAEIFGKHSKKLFDLIPVRNRVMHGRPLLTDDLIDSASSLLLIDTSGFGGEALSRVLQQIRLDPNWLPAGQIEVRGSAVLNNLPLTYDTDDVGLIGRRKEREELVAQTLKLARSRSPLLSIIGPGGVGKTALALWVLHDIAEMADSPFDMIAWVSLKTERLTALGIESIENAIASLDAAVPFIGQTLDTSFEGSLDSLAEALSDLNVLLAIDNLETVSGAEVIRVIDALPDSVSYLITSRIGVGELERRYPLGPLDERFAKELLRRAATARHVDHLAKIPNDAASSILRRLGTSPLAIRWFVAAAESGADVDRILSRRADLVNFCVSNVFEGLDENGRAVAEILYLLARPMTVQELALFVDDTSPDELRLALQNLDRRMLVRRSFAGGATNETWEPSEALRDYMRTTGVSDAGRSSAVRAADDKYRRAQERHRLDLLNDPLRPTVIHGSEEHKGSFIYLRDALSFSRKERIDDALSSLSLAESLDPEYFEIFRVRGFILSQAGRVEEATASYERALELAWDEQSSAIVMFFFAGHLTRRAHMVARAENLARRAHQILASPKSALELGKALVYLDRFDEADEELIGVAASQDLKTRLIGVSLRLELRLRRAEQEHSELRRPDLAVTTLLGGVPLALESLEGGLMDARLRDLVHQNVATMLQICNKVQDFELVASAIRSTVSSLDLIQTGPAGARLVHGLVPHVERLVRRWPALPEVAPEVEALLGELDARSEPAVTGEVGTVKRWLSGRHFGFITSADENEDMWFSRSKLADAADEILLKRGVMVRFNRSTDRAGRFQADDVQVSIERRPNVFHDRELTVRRIHERFLFAEDSESGATVFVGRHSLRNEDDWSWIEEGFTLYADVEVNEQAQFSALSGSTRVP